MHSKSLTLGDKRNLVEKVAQDLDRRHEVIFAYIFGSFSEEAEFNDIDIAIYLDEQAVQKSGNDLWYEIELSKALERLLNLPVDVIRLNHASDFMIYRASKGILVKNNNDNLRVEFITRSWKNYLEFKPKLQEYIEVMKGG
jgi:hypothetical protein